MKNSHRNTSASTAAVKRNLLYAWLYVTVGQYEHVIDPAVPRDTIVANLLANLRNGNHVKIPSGDKLETTIGAWVDAVRADSGAYGAAANLLLVSGPGDWTGGPDHPNLLELDASFVPST
jgi:hypothetical protein